MTANQAESYLDNPQFRQAMESMQKGEWESGLSQIETLMQAYPLESDLRSLRQEMILRAKVDTDEKVAKSYARRRRSRDLIVRAAVVSVLVIIAIFVATSYASWFQDQAALAKQAVDSQVVLVELQVNMRDAQSYLGAGMTDSALELLEKIEVIKPDFPELAQTIEQARRQKAFDEQYAEAMILIEQDQLDAALIVLQEIESQEPYYRDVKSQIKQIQDETVLGEQLLEADAYFENESWEEAATAYYNLYALNPDFETAHVEDRLFTSYVNSAEEKLNNSDSLESIQSVEEYFRRALALRPQDLDVKDKQSQVRSMIEEKLFWSFVQAAQTAIAEEPNSLEALKVANRYFSEALALRPNDPEITLQRELAHQFLGGMDDFVSSSNSSAIEKLEFVYSQDPGYINGTARQTLYEAYVARGDNAMAIGDFDSALEDFQRAAVIANEDPTSRARLYEIQLKIAEAQGLMGDFESAVRLYAAAILIGDLQARAATYSSAMAAALTNASQFEGQGNFREAFRSYREAITWATQVFDVVVHVVESDDYLSQLALDYNSTVSLIAAANNLANPNIIIPGQELLIPILP
jgi:tetratricopeptide (TPR) repeat protein